jgi:hypothetical protein
MIDLSEPRDVTPARMGDSAPAVRRAWRPPSCEALPPLVDLTLQSPIVGGEGGFGWLDANRPSNRLGAPSTRA